MFPAFSDGKFHDLGVLFLLYEELLDQFLGMVTYRVVVEAKGAGNFVLITIFVINDVQKDLPGVFIPEEGEGSLNFGIPETLRVIDPLAIYFC